jgi:hypothetical protein
MQLFSTFASLLLCLSLVSQSVGRGLITSPANGTAIKPGQSFNFSYEAHTDYCVSSFNYTVWLLTTNPATARLGLDNVFGYGRFLGRFAQESYPSKLIVVSAHDNLLTSMLSVHSQSVSDESSAAAARDA